MVTRTIIEIEEVKSQALEAPLAASQQLGTILHSETSAHEGAPKFRRFISRGSLHALGTDANNGLANSYLKYAEISLVSVF